MVTVIQIQPVNINKFVISRKGQKEHDYLYFEFQEMNGRQAVRKGPWKLVHMNIRGEKDYFELYNIEGAHVPNPYFPVLKRENARTSDT